MRRGRRSLTKKRKYRTRRERMLMQALKRKLHRKRIEVLGRASRKIKQARLGFNLSKP